MVVGSDCSFIVEKYYLIHFIKILLLSMVFITISISLFLSKTDHCALPLIDHVKWLKDRLGLVFFGASQFVIPEKTWKISYRWWHNWQLIIMIWLSGLPSGLFWNTVLKCCLSRIECNRLFGLSLDYFLFVWKILYLKLVMVMVMVILIGHINVTEKS